MIKTCNCVVKNMNAEIDKSPYAATIYFILTIIGFSIAILSFFGIFLPGIGYVVLKTFPQIMYLLRFRYGFSSYLFVGLLSCIACMVLYYSPFIVRVVFAILKHLLLSFYFLLKAFYISITKCFSNNQVVG